MTEKDVQHQIQEQLIALRRAADEAIKSREAANKYLEEAGITTHEEHKEEKDAKFDDNKKQ